MDSYRRIWERIAVNGLWERIERIWERIAVNGFEERIERIWERITVNGLWERIERIWERIAVNGFEERIERIWERITNLTISCRLFNELRFNSCHAGTVIAIMETMDFSCLIATPIRTHSYPSVPIRTRPYPSVDSYPFNPFP